MMARDLSKEFQPLDSIWIKQKSKFNRLKLFRRPLLAQQILRRYRSLSITLHQKCKIQLLILWNTGTTSRQWWIKLSPRLEKAKQIPCSPWERKSSMRLFTQTWHRREERLILNYALIISCKLNKLHWHLISQRRKLLSTTQFRSKIRLIQIRLTIEGNLTILIS